MLRAVRYFTFFFIVSSCVEPYEFVIDDNSRGLVVEGFISDKSFNETLSYPCDGRYFSIRLTYTGDVTNFRPEPARGALVTLISDANEEWVYSELPEEPGNYKLMDDSFEAAQGLQYKLRISLAEDIYESDWEKLPDTAIPEMGEIGFVETEKQKYLIEANKPVVRTIKEITANITVPKNNTGKSNYYKWQFAPMWIYRAPLSPSVTAPGHICWVTDVNYINSYALQKDNSGGYKKELFSIPTVRNERIFEDLSVLVTQYAMSERYYTFWKEIKDKNEGSALIDIPPYNTLVNIRPLNNDRSVSGYFSVVNEQARRWYFNKEDLSYLVVNTLKADCSVNYGPPLPGCPIPSPPVACECKYCPEYSFGIASEVKPSWWRK